MHGEEMKYITEAYETNWMSTVGANISEVERIAAEKAGVRYAVALSSCTAALHLCVRLAGQRLYGRPSPGHGALEGKHVFCPDMTFVASVNPVLYEGGTPVLIDLEQDTWSMDPLALEMAFQRFPEVRLVIAAHLYGFPGRIDALRAVCDRHGALLIEDAAESLGAAYGGQQTGSFGDYGAISYNGNKIITGSSGGCLLTNDPQEAALALRWATQARESAAWYQHEAVGYNYRMSNVVAGVVRGQYPYLEEHITRKKQIYERYQAGLLDLPITLNPFDAQLSMPSYWLSCMLIEPDAMCAQRRTALSAQYLPEHGRSCPTEILEALSVLNAEGRPFWKPMSAQPLFSTCSLIGRNGPLRAADAGQGQPVSWGLFERGLCLPSDIKLTPADQDCIISTIRQCFA